MAPIFYIRVGPDQRHPKGIYLHSDQLAKWLAQSYPMAAKAIRRFSEQARQSVDTTTVEVVEEVAAKREP